MHHGTWLEDFSAFRGASGWLSFTIELHTISLPESDRRRGIHLQCPIWSGAGHQTIGSFNVSESLMWFGIFLNQIQLCDRNYTAMCN